MSMSQKTTPRRGSEIEFNQSTASNTDKRSKLHNGSTIHWLRRRHQNTANLNYLYLPEEIQTHLEVQNVFDLIDEDKSGKLALHEFYNMLRQAKIKIGMNDLKQFYKKVDDDCDIALDFREFKNCTLSEEANLHFAKMMQNVRKAHENTPPRVRNSLKSQTTIPKVETKERKDSKEDTEEKEDAKTRSNKPFLPRTFGTLLNYLAYLTKKKDMVEYINNKNYDSEQKFHKFGELIDLQMDKDIYLEQYNTKLHRNPNSINTGQLTARSTARSQPDYAESRRSMSQDDQLNAKKSKFNLSSLKIGSKEDVNPGNQGQFLKGLEEMIQKTRLDAKSEFYQKQCLSFRPPNTLFRSPSSSGTEQVFAQKDGARKLNSHRISLKSRGANTAANSPQRDNNEQGGTPTAVTTPKKLFSGMLNYELKNLSSMTPQNENYENQIFERKQTKDYALNDVNLRLTTNAFELRNNLQKHLRAQSQVTGDGLKKEDNISSYQPSWFPQTARGNDTKIHHSPSFPSQMASSSQQLQSYRETPNQMSDYIASDIYSQCPVTRFSKMPFHYDSVSPTFNYYCNSTTNKANSRKRSKTRTVFVGLSSTAQTSKLQPESAKIPPSHASANGNGNSGLKIEEAPLKKKRNQIKTILNPLASFQENLVMKLQAEVEKGPKRKTKIQLRGERMQPVSLDSSVRKR